jgi:short subunit dehydrogenase-like uncharacterized protein
MVYNAKKQKYDIVLFGATGFTGGLAAKYLSTQYGKKVSWAIAGRSLAKLEAVKATLDGCAGIIVADADDEAALTLMCNQTAVVATTAGPFTRHGNKLVATCVKTGTAYCVSTLSLSPFLPLSLFLTITLPSFLPSSIGYYR